MDYMDEKEIKFYQSSKDFFKSKKNQRIILMTTKASISYTKFKFERNDTILFGRESSLNSLCTTKKRLLIGAFSICLLITYLVNYVFGKHRINSF